MPLDVKTAVKQWITAEYHFRFGKNHHSTFSQSFYIQAENQLRQALTGKIGLMDAAEAVGISIEKCADPVLGRSGKMPVVKTVKKLIKRGAKIT